MNNRQGQGQTECHCHAANPWTRLLCRCRQRWVHRDKHCSNCSLVQSLSQWTTHTWQSLGWSRIDCSRQPATETRGTPIQCHNLHTTNAQISGGSRLLWARERADWSGALKFYNNYTDQHFDIKAEGWPQMSRCFHQGNNRNTWKHTGDIGARLASSIEAASLGATRQRRRY